MYPVVGPVCPDCIDAYNPGWHLGPDDEYPWYAHKVLDEVKPVDATCVRQDCNRVRFNGLLVCKECAEKLVSQLSGEQRYG